MKEIQKHFCFGIFLFVFENEDYLYVHTYKFWGPFFHFCYFWCNLGEVQFAPNSLKFTILLTFFVVWREAITEDVHLSITRIQSIIIIINILPTHARKCKIENSKKKLEIYLTRSMKVDIFVCVYCPLKARPARFYTLYFHFSVHTFKLKTNNQKVLKQSATISDRYQRANLFSISESSKRR